MTIAAEPKAEAPAPAPEAAAPAAPAAQPVAAAAPAPEAKPGEPTPAPEAKKEGEDTILGVDGKPKEVKAEVIQGAPEKYTDFKMPEGMTVNKELMDKASAEFKALNLSQEQAQKLVALQAESAKALTDAALNDYHKQIETWKQDSVKMYGAKSNEEFGIAAQAINRFGTPELRAVLNETGLGNHPELVKFFVQVGHAIKEDNPADGRRVEGRVSDADIFYGTTMKKKGE